MQWRREGLWLWRPGSWIIFGAPPPTDFWFVRHRWCRKICKINAAKACASPTLFLLLPANCVFKLTSVASSTVNYGNWHVFNTFKIIDQSIYHNTATKSPLKNSAPSPGVAPPPSAGARGQLYPLSPSSRRHWRSTLHGRQQWILSSGPGLTVVCSTLFRKLVFHGLQFTESSTSTSIGVIAFSWCVSERCRLQRGTNGLAYHATVWSHSAAPVFSRPVVTKV